MCVLHGTLYCMKHYSVLYCMRHCIVSVFLYETLYCVYIVLYGTLYCVYCIVRCTVLCLYCCMGWLRLVGSIKLKVSLVKEPHKRDDILQKRPKNLSILLTVATPYETLYCIVSILCCMRHYIVSILYNMRLDDIWNPIWHSVSYWLTEILLNFCQPIHIWDLRIFGQSVIVTTHTSGVRVLNKHSDCIICES